MTRVMAHKNEGSKRDPKKKSTPAGVKEKLRGTSTKDEESTEKEG